jgi:hypothetical protein
MGYMGQLDRETRLYEPVRVRHGHVRWRSIIELAAV